MNWKILRYAPWIDTRSSFVSTTPRGGSLLDIGSSDGETLRHMAELRPDVKFFATDISGAPENYPDGCDFYRVDMETGRLPWPDETMDRISCMHLVEHLRSPDNCLNEARRLLKPQGRLYIETPHPRTVDLPSLKDAPTTSFTMNFYDDPTHVAPVSTQTIEAKCVDLGLRIVKRGVSRNLLFAVAYPFFFRFSRPSRRKYTSLAHFLGWSAFVIAEKPE